MGNLGLELVSFINSDLTWKTTAKGSRSATRRGRKFGYSSFTVYNPADEGTIKGDDTTVSDTAKRGVAVLGHHFCEGMDQVPIKKRRFALPASSQSPRSSSPSIDTQESNADAKRQQKATNASVALKFSQDNISGISDCKWSDDFSGIRILASVACNNDFFSDVDHDNGSSLMEESIEILAGLACNSRTFNDVNHDERSSLMGASIQEAVGTSIATSPSDLLNKDIIGTSSLQDGIVTVSENWLGTKDDSTTEGPASLQNERLHFDLNVPWEQLCDSLCVDFGANAVQSCEMQGQEGIKYDSTNRTVFTDVIGDHNVSVDMKAIPALTHASDEETRSLASTQDGNHDQRVPSPHVNSKKVLTADSVDARASSHIVGMDACLGQLTCPGFSNESRDVSLSDIETKQTTDVQLEKVMCSKSVQFETCHISPPLLKQSGDEDHQKASSLLKDGEPIQGKSGLTSCQPTGSILHGAEPGNQAGESGGYLCVPSCRDISVSAIPIVDGQPVAADNVKGQSNGTSAINFAKDDSSFRSGSVVLMQKPLADSTVNSREVTCVPGKGDTDRSATFAIENPSDESDVDQADKVHMGRTKTSVELQAGYDSQFEDGELRESDDPYFWDEYGEVEHVDYASDLEDDTLSGLDTEHDVKDERGSSPGYDNDSRKIKNGGAGDAPRDDLPSPRRRTRTLDLLTDEGRPSESFGFRASNREFLSRNEGSNIVHWNDSEPGHRIDNNYDPYSQDGREAGSKNFMRIDRPASHMRGRSPKRRIIDRSAKCWASSERYYSPIHHGTYTSGLHRPRVNTENHGSGMPSDPDHTDSEVVWFADNRARRPFTNPLSKGVVYKRSNRRSPGSHDDTYCIPTGMLPVRDGSPIRRRFRRFADGTARSAREDDNEYSNLFAERLAKRERTVSPTNRGRPYYSALSYKRTWLRSGSGSPISYLPRERNEGSRLRSRSPDFRSDIRMDRRRVPFQKRFPAEFDEEFVSQTRRRMQTRHHSRWFDDRNVAFDNFRCKSPSPKLRLSRRFRTAHFGRSIVDADYQYRPLMQPKKYPDTGDGGRGGGYAGSDDDRRQRSNRFEMVHRGRRYDTNGVVRRFRYNEGDSFRALGQRYSCNDSDRVVARRDREIVPCSGFWR